jgi:hypothetical protein
MINKDELLERTNGKTDEEIKQILQDEYNINWDPYGRCKSWYAKVFTYCNSDQLEEELLFFLWVIHFFSSLFQVCFQQEDTVFLGCICPCGHKQTMNTMEF